MAARKESLRNSEERNAIVLEHLKLVPFLIKRYLWHREDVRHLGIDDAVQIGNLVLIRAAELWDPDRGMRFSSYVGKSLIAKVSEAAMARHGRRHVRNKDAPHVLHLSQLRFDWAESHIGIHSFMPYGTLVDDTMHRKTLENMEYRSSVARKVLASLDNPRHRLVLYLRCWQRMTLDMVGVAMGITRERVRQIELKAKKAAFDLMASWKEECW
jgi:RNA polymerase sigma factor (sigma-70 family)